MIKEYELDRYLTFAHRKVFIPYEHCKRTILISTDNDTSVPLDRGYFNFINIGWTVCFSALKEDMENDLE